LAKTAEPRSLAIVNLEIAFVIARQANEFGIPLHIRLRYAGVHSDKPWRYHVQHDARMDWRLSNHFEFCLM